MKFKNCSLKHFERTTTDDRTDGRMEGRTDLLKAICPFNFSKVWDKMKILNTTVP